MLRLLFLVGLAFAGVVVLSLHAPVRHASSRQLQIAKKCNPIRLNTQKENEEPSEKNKYLKHQCKSCSYVYDEEKGFKKRFPPGTEFLIVRISC